MNPWLSARNLLAVRLDNIGDVIMLGPALRAIKETSPEASLTLLATPSGASAAPLLPWVDDVMIWRPVWQDVHGRIPFDPDREIGFARALSGRGFDGALVFTSFSQTPHVPGYVCYLAGIPLRAGESKEFAGGTLTIEVKGTPDDAHQVERNLRLVEAAGFVAGDRRLAIHLDRSARDAVPRLLHDAGLDPRHPFILLHPGASAQSRRYPAERFGAVARGLTMLGRQVLVTGIEKEAPLLARVAAAAPGAKLLVGDTTLMEYAALVEAASLVLCGNTLPLHLADAVGTPLVVLYSGTDYEEQWRPRSTLSVLLREPTPCHPCYLFDCPIGQPCLAVSPERVVAAAEQMLTVKAPGSRVAP